MSDKLSQLFKNMPEIEPSAGLAGMVFQSIQQEEAKKIRWQLRFTKIVSAGCALAAAYGVFVFGSALLNSEFANMLSLSFSDLNVIAVNWGDYFQSLAETFPTLTAIGLLVPIFAFFISISSYLNLNERRHKYI